MASSFEQPLESVTYLQRLASAFRSHFKMLVDVLDPDEAALALYQEKLISKTTLEEAVGSNLPKSKRSYRLVEAVETVLGICDSTTTAHRILVILETNSTSGPDNSVIARIRRQAKAGSGEKEIDTTDHPGALISDPPTLLELKTMKGADGKPLRIIQTIAAHDYATFGMCLLQDMNGEEVELIKKNHIQDGAESVTQAILKKWLTSGAPTRTYQHLIECLRQSELGALAELIENTRL